MDQTWLGLGLILIGGMLHGSFAVPQRRIRDWPWEKIWLIYSCTGMVLFPWLILAIALPSPVAVYTSVSGSNLALALLFGAGWGIGSVFFGLAVDAVGVGLAFGIILSLTAALGSVVPLLIKSPGQLFTAKGGLLMLGLAIGIAGVALCARAGALKEAALSAKKARPGAGFLRGLLICIASGVTSPMMNFSQAFGKPIVDEAVRSGASPVTAWIAVLAAATAAGFLINAGYCLWLLNRNHTWKSKDARTGRDTLAATLMGFLWLFGMFLYFVGAGRMGDLGSVLGWPIFMSVVLLIANGWGLLMGEWHGAGTAAMRSLGFGTALMILEIAVISLGSRP